jgi:hypothetical protein
LPIYGLGAGEQFVERRPQSRAEEASFEFAFSHIRASQLHREALPKRRAEPDDELRLE